LGSDCQRTGSGFGNRSQIQTVPLPQIEAVMTYKSIKLLALAVICGCSLIGFAIRPANEGMILFFVFVVTAIWFICYWFWIEDKRNWPK
jgi:hypothetical protein